MLYVPVLITLDNKQMSDYPLQQTTFHDIPGNRNMDFNSKAQTSTTGFKRLASTMSTVQKYTTPYTRRYYSHCFTIEVLEMQHLIVHTWPMSLVFSPL